MNWWKIKMYTIEHTFLICSNATIVQHIHFGKKNTLKKSGYQSRLPNRSWPNAQLPESFPADVITNWFGRTTVWLIISNKCILMYIHWVQLITAVHLYSISRWPHNIKIVIVLLASVIVHCSYSAHNFFIKYNFF